MVKPRLFISHSSADPANFLNDLITNLSGKFDVLVDTGNLPPGCKWRDEIFTWIGLCQAAVILLSKNSLKSIWVQRESSILLWRKTHDPDKFVLIPILLEESIETEIKQSELFKDLDLTGFQGIKAIQKDSSAKTIEEINSQLSEVVLDEVQKSPFKDVVDTIAFKLRELDIRLIQEVLDLVKMHLFNWDKIPGDDNEKLMEFLEQSFNISGISPDNIEKIDNGKTIILNKDKSLSLTMNDEKTKVSITVEKSYEFIVKKEDDGLNIFRKIELGPWTPDPKRHLALALLQVGMRNSSDALNELCKYISSDEIDEIMYLIEPSWVDICAARWVAHYSSNKIRKQAILLNTAEKFSAEMYVRRACCCPRKSEWPVYDFPNIWGGRAAGEIADEIIRAIMGCPNEKPLTDRERGIFKKALDGVIDKMPVFVVWNLSAEENEPDLYMRKLLPEITKLLPKFTFFILTGEKFPAQEERVKLEESGLKFIEPPLKPGTENKALEDRLCVDIQFKRNKDKFRRN